MNTITLLALSLIAQAPTQVTADGIYAGFPHNVHDTRVFNGTWSSGVPQGTRRAVITEFSPGRYRVSFQQQFPGSVTWHSSLSVEIPAGSNEYRYHTYRYGGNPFMPTIIGELYPPVVIRVQ